MRTWLVALVLLAPLAALADTTPPAILASPAKVPAAGEPLVIEAQIVDESGIFDPTVYWRRAGTKEFDVAKMTGEGQTFRASIALPPDVTVVEYYIEAYDSEGNGPARFGAPVLPVKLDLTPPPVAVAPPAATPAPAKVEAKAEPKVKTAPKVEKKKPEAPAAAVAKADPAEDREHTIDVRPQPAWKLPTALGLLVAGAGLAAGGVVMLRGARTDANAFNDRFNRQGAFDDAQARALSSRQSLSVGLAAAGGVLLAGGVATFAITF